MTPSPVGYRPDRPGRWARWRRRVNRFLGEVQTPEGTLLVHVPSTGRLAELLVPDAVCRLLGAGPGARKTGWDLWAVRQGGVMVGVDTRLPGHLLPGLARGGWIPGIGPVLAVRTEAALGPVRVDARLETPAGPVWIEAKLANRAVEGEARFPDAPTARGVRQLRALARLAPAAAWVVFLVAREDANALRVDREQDPAFWEEVRKAREEGVRMLAVRLRVSAQEAVACGHVPVRV